MQRILPITLITSVLVAIFAGAAYARLSNGDSVPAQKMAAMHVPQALPEVDPAHDGAYGYRTSKQIAQSFQGPSDKNRQGGASSSVTVSAIVLPVVIVVFDRQGGNALKLVTNTADRSHKDVLFLPRLGSESGAALELDARMWSSAKYALTKAHAGTGMVWSR